MRDLVTPLAARFILPGTAVVDLGASRGAGIAPLVERFGATVTWHLRELPRPCWPPSGPASPPCLTRHGEFQLQESDWHLPSDTPAEFIRHMIGEAVLESKNSHGFTVREWHKIGPNHYLDCAKYACAARYALAGNLRNLRPRANAPPPAAPRVSGTKPPGWDQA